MRSVAVIVLALFGKVEFTRPQAHLVVTCALIMGQVFVVEQCLVEVAQMITDSCQQELQSRSQQTHLLSAPILTT